MLTQGKSAGFYKAGLNGSSQQGEQIDFRTLGPAIYILT